MPSLASLGQFNGPLQPVVPSDPPSVMPPLQGALSLPPGWSGPCYIQVVVEGATP